MRAYSGTGHPDKVVEIGARLMARGLQNVFADPTEILSVLYLTTLSADQLRRPRSDDQRTVFRAASEALLDYTPVFFATDRRPANITENDWKSARQYMESAANKVLATARH